MWRDWDEISKKSGIIFGVIAIIFSLLNLGLYYQFNMDRLRLDGEMAELEQEIYQIRNFNTTIRGREDFIRLKSHHFQRYENGTINYIHFNGSLQSTISVLTPHFGQLEVVIKNFTLQNSIMFRNGTEKYSEVSFVRQPSDFPIYQGWNHIELDIPLVCTVHPSWTLLPLPGESTQFVIGQLHFEIIFFDEQINTYVIHGFDSEVHGTITIPEV